MTDQDLTRIEDDLTDWDNAPARSDVRDLIVEIRRLRAEGLTSKIRALTALCAGSVTVSINEHRNNYESVDAWLTSGEHNPPGEVRARMVEAGTTVYVQCYPNSPVGFVDFVHHDLDEAIALALAGVRNA